MTDENSQLAQNILKQVEYYFSKQNLQSDHYLISKMNPQLFVPLEVVAGFKMLRNLTTDLDLIKRVLKNSSKVQLDESGPQCMIRPRFATAARTTIILRDIPKTTPENEIKAIFPNSDKITSMKPDIGDTWFVTFQEEEDCKKAYDSTLEASFKGNPVKARIKSENLLKNVIPTFAGPTEQPIPPPMFAPPATNPFVPFGAPPPMQMPYPYLMSTGMASFAPPQMMSSSEVYGLPTQASITSVSINAPLASSAQNAPLEQAGRGAGRRGNAGRGRGRTGYNRGAGQNYRQEANEKYAKPSPKKTFAKQSLTPKLGPQDFPPLPSSSHPVSGYEKAFKRFSKAEIVAVLSTLQNAEVPLPPDMPLDCPAVSKETIRDIELLRTNENVEPASEAVSRPKTFAEAAITAKDIKSPEKTVRRNVNAKKGPQVVQGDETNGFEGGETASKNPQNNYRNRNEGVDYPRKNQARRSYKQAKSKPAASPQVPAGGT